MTSAVENPQKLTVVFVPATAYMDKQRLAYFGPFLIPGDDLGFWRSSVTFSMIVLVLAIIAVGFWRIRAQRALPQPPAHAQSDGPTRDAPSRSPDE